MARIAVVFCLLLAAVVVAAKKRKPPAIAGRIVNGRDTDISEVPYQVSLQFFGNHDCGGSIIGRKHVLTAAHCVYWGITSDYTIRAGSKFHRSGGEIRKVKKITPHPMYQLSSVDFDIALLELEENLVFNENTKAIVFADKEPEKGDQVLVSGWGALKENGSYSESLKSFTVQVVGRGYCKKIHKNFNTVTENMFCAGYTKGNKDACTGDSGGPAVVNRHLAGIISWGDGCAKPRTPGVYTNVAKFRQWIWKAFYAKD